MFLHLGGSTVVLEKTIIGVFDLDTATVTADGKEFLKNAEKNLSVTTVGEELPKSFVVTCENSLTRVYLTEVSTGTLKKRREQI
ncbi:MAG: DUF370 domain-containing protein [Oscillospiraceae bacterium]